MMATAKKRAAGGRGGVSAGAKRAAAGGGIAAKGGARLQSTGRNVGRGGPIGSSIAKGSSPAFGINSKGRGDGGKSPGRASGGAKAQPLAEHVPNHTFASTTMPRASRKKAGKGVFDPDHDGDNDASPTGDTDHDYVLPNGKPGPKALKGKKSMAMPDDDQTYADTSASADQNVRKGRNANGYTDLNSTDGQDTQMPTPHLADGAKQKKLPKQMIKPSKVGTFTAKAKAAGYPSALAYANSVMNNPGSHDPATVKQANFAKNFGNASKKRAKS